MIDLLNTWGSSWVAYFGPAVLQNTIFLTLILAGLHILRNARARWRYTLCLIGTVKLLLPPFLRTGLLEAPGRAFPVGYLVDLSAGVPSSAAGGPEVSGLSFGVSLSGVLFAIWAGVVLVCLVRATLSVVHLGRALKQAVPAGRSPAESQTGSGAEVLRTAAVPVPLAFGLLHPKVYVPEDWNTWDDRCRNLVLAHEAAHIRRRDGIAQVLQVIARALYFFHPLVWLLDRRMNEYREMACDDAVTEISAGGSAAYSRHLMEVAERVMLGRVSWRSASAFLRHRNGLLGRVRYQLEVKKMKTMSARTRALVFAALLLFVLPLSWYCGEAETKQADVTAGSDASSKQGAMKEVTVVLKPDRMVSVDGKVAAMDKLEAILQARFPSDRDHVLVRLNCEDGVAMERVSEAHRMLIDLDLRKVLYEGAPEKGLPLVLPSTDNMEKLASLDKHDVAVVKVDLPGRAVLDGKPIKVAKLEQTIAERLAENPHLVVSLSWAPTARYEDFILVLGLVKAAGATRVAVKIGV